MFLFYKLYLSFIIWLLKNSSSPLRTRFNYIHLQLSLQVDASASDTFTEAFQGLNLNLPPKTSEASVPELVEVNAHVNIQPGVGGDLLKPSSSVSPMEPVKPTDDAQRTNEQELHFPINDSLVVPFSAPVLYPIVDASEPALIVDLSEATPSAVAPYPTPALALASDAASSTEETNANNGVEETLLKELAEMGFKQVDLNKEILRLNEYNLEQSVDDLCGVSEWDPILEELQEMVRMASLLCVLLVLLQYFLSPPNVELNVGSCFCGRVSLILKRTRSCW